MTKTWGSGTLKILLSKDGEVILEDSKEISDEDTFTWRVDAPVLWSAEDPQLYDLELTVSDANGNVQEIIPQKVGFRRFEMKDGIMTLNGKRIVFKGVNRHEFSSVSGRHVSEEELRKDLTTMKLNNINAIRTCHYPDMSKIYELCDEFGLYMIDETNLESHGSWDVAEMTKDFTYTVPHNKPEWLEMMLDRANSMYQRDKNHPAILIWHAVMSLSVEKIFLKCHSYSTEKIRPDLFTMKVSAMIVVTTTPVIWKVRCIRLWKQSRSSLQKMTANRSSAVSTHMQWEIPAVQCTSIQI